MQDSKTHRFKAPSQELIVLLMTVIIFLFFAFMIDGFTDLGNLSTLVKNISVLGILGLGMAIVVIGRGIDLAQVGGMAITSAWVVQHLQWGFLSAILIGLVAAIMIGAINGFLVAFVEIPAIFTTLATNMVIMGGGRTLLGASIVYVPEESEGFLFIGQGEFLGIPMPIVFFAIIALITHIFLSRTMHGHFVYAQGDNLETSRLTGIAVRPLTILQYVLCSSIAYFAGLIQAGSIAQVNIRFDANLIFNVILVVVLGGVSLIGGRGSVKSVLVGALLIGTLLNGMILMDIQSDIQNIIRSFVLLFALLLDNRLHPRDEETARQGDI